VVETHKIYIQLLLCSRYLYDNQLTGSIPSEIGLMDSSLMRLDLSYNQLTGSVPTDIATMYYPFKDF